MRKVAKVLGVSAFLFVLAVPAQASVRYAIGSSRVTFRSFPDEYVLGSATNSGWTIDVQGNQSQGYRWGYLSGPGFSGCAWITSKALGAKQGASAGSPCPTTGRTVHGFTNGDVSSMTLPSGKKDGVTMTISPSRCPNGAPENLNVNPGANPSTPSGADGKVYAPHTHVRFRYTSADGQWAMVRDPTISGGKGWGFIPRTCVVPAG